MCPPPRPRKLRGAELAAAEAAAAAARRRAKRLRKVAAAVAVVLTVIALLDQASRAPELTIPRVHRLVLGVVVVVFVVHLFLSTPPLFRLAQCDPTVEEYERDFIMCKGTGASHSVFPVTLGTKLRAK